MLRGMQQNPALDYEVVGFVDNQSLKTGLSVRGIRVLGSRADLAPLVKRHGIEMILIAMPSANGHQMTRILQRCQEAVGRTPVRLKQEAISARLGKSCPSPARRGPSDPSCAARSRAF